MILKSDFRYFEKARKIVQLSDYANIHVGCVAVYQGSVIGNGCNCNKTHPSQKYYNKYRSQNIELPPKLHAEISCINSIKHMDINFHKVKLYIYRILKDQLFRLARLCASCMATIQDVGIRDIYYTTNYGYTYERINGFIRGGVT